MKLAVGVVARGNEVASARLLARSLAAHHPDWPVTLLVMPGLRPAIEAQSDRLDVIRAADLAQLDLEPLLMGAPPGPLAVYLRPLLMRHLLDGGAEAALLLPPDAEVAGPLTELVTALTGADAVLVPRVQALPDDHERPDAHDLLEAGEIDDELVALRATEGGLELLDWWIAQGREAAEVAAAISTVGRGDPPSARLAASPLGAAQRAFPNVACLDHPGYDVSYWNLHERPLAGESGAVTAAGQPVRLFRFTGFEPERPWWLSTDATRTLVLDHPLLEAWLGRRAQELLEAGWITAFELQSVDELPNGLCYDERLRRLHAEAIDAGEDFGDVFSLAGADAFAAWLRASAPRGRGAGITRYAYDVWRQRPDVQQAYRDLDGPDGEGFVGWLWVHGRPESGLQPALLPPAPDWVDTVERRVPPVLVTGYLRGTLGLGAAARGYVQAMEAAGVPVATRSVATDPPVDERTAARRRVDEREFADLTLEPGSEPEVHLLCVNPEQAAAFAADFGEEELRSRYTIGQWAWETNVVPDAWSRAFELVNEVWVYSSYVAESVSRAGEVPVVVVPPPIVPPDPRGSAVPFEIPDGFLFLFAFDFFSTTKRKNPVGLVEAFKRAFSPADGHTLLLKTINGDFRPQEREAIRHAIGDRADIRLVDRNLSPDEMAALLHRADCFVSLHRSEGFGLGLAEAMALGKPVIGTAYSGNTDFMTPANSYLVDWRPTDVGWDAGHYPAGGTWAEPSLEHAAELMRSVVDDPAQADQRGRRAREDIAATLSPQAVGAIAKARLERIGARLGERSISATPPYPLDEVPRRLHFDLTGDNGGGGVKSVARRAVMRALRPYTSRERHLDEAMAGALHRLYVELEAARAARERDRRRIERLERRIAELVERRS